MDCNVGRYQGDPVPGAHRHLDIMVAQDALQRQNVAT